MSYLGLGEAETVGQLLPLRSHHIMVLLEGVLQPEELGRGEGGSDPFGFPGQSVVQQEALRTGVIACRGDTQGSEYKSYRVCMYTFILHLSTVY